MKDFFISYNDKDQQWAKWIAWILEEAGYTTVIQAWDFRPGGNFVIDMQKAATGTRRTIAVLSQNYLDSVYTQPEWANAFAHDPQGDKRALIPVRIDECRPTGLLSQIIYVDIQGLPADDARVAILGAFSERAKPSEPPLFPGPTTTTTTTTTTPAPIPPAERVSPNPVAYPGTAHDAAAISYLHLQDKAHAEVSKRSLSIAERVKLNEQLNALAAQHFNMLIFALNPPAGLIPPMPAPQADRAFHLLQWAESAGGCGLSIVMEAVGQILRHLPMPAPLRPDDGPKETTTPSPLAIAPLVPTSPVVISIHGIRTRGAWQKESLGKALNENGFVHVALDFGFFGATQLLIPPLRHRKIDWFRDKYTEHHKEGSPLPCVIAHSFGTYLVARLMQIYSNSGFDFGRIIFCGSIVQRRYPWTAMINGNRCQAALNDYGQMDCWARIAKYLIKDAGDSGVRGFHDEANGRVLQRCHPEFRHSDYFFEANYRNNWIPFLLGKQPKPLTAADRPTRNWHYTITSAVIILVLFGALAVGGWWVLAPTRPVFDSITFPQIVKEHEAPDFPSTLKAYRASHLGKQVEWEVVIFEKVPNGYRITPVPDHLAYFKVLAKYDPGDPVEPLTNKAKVKIRAIIDDITVSDIGLRNLQLIDRLD